MSERREFRRMRLPAHVRIAPLDKEDEPEARARLAARRVDRARTPRIEDPGATGEWRQLLDGIARMAIALERIERRLDRLDPAAPSPPDALVIGPTPIDLSASGFAFQASLDLDPGQLVAVELDMPETGLPPIAALARFLGPRDARAPSCAFHFEQIHPDDLERVVQLGLRMQSQELRSQRAREERP